MGAYYSTFYGNTKDPSVLAGKPMLIRSDEYVVNTQMTIAQYNNHFDRINHNIGNGEDMSLYLDVPYKDWSQFFKPHNLVFFALPLDYAFAFKWWLMGYLLILSCYFFLLEVLPSKNKRYIAAALSLALFFSPFIQWWYQYITLAPIYYSLFAGTIILRLVKAKFLKESLLWGLLLTYVGTCFALVLYPPFQIPCILSIGAFVLGFLVQRYRRSKPKDWLPKIAVLAASLILAGLLILLFVFTRLSTVRAYENTAYPGNRLTQSGGYSLTHLFSGNLDFQLQFTQKAANYQIPKNGLTNQSESSMFFLLLPFLFLPCIYILLEDFRKKNEMDWPLLFVNLIFIVYLGWLYIPKLPIIGKLLFLDRVPLNRLVIGLGLINILQIVLFIRRGFNFSNTKLKKILTLGYVLLLFIFCLYLDFLAKKDFPGFLGQYRAIAFAIPAPIIIYFLLKRSYRAAVNVFLAFTAIMCIAVNPINIGTSILTKTPISSAIKKVASQDPKSKWVIEDSEFENFASMNGAPTLNGVYAYPQLKLWKPLNTGHLSYIYNRYAHVVVNFNRNNTPAPTILSLPSPDHFAIETDPCSDYLLKEDVHFAVTTVPLNSTSESCIHLKDTVTYPNIIFYIYKLN